MCLYNGHIETVLCSAGLTLSHISEYCLFRKDLGFYLFHPLFNEVSCICHVDVRESGIRSQPTREKNACVKIVIRRKDVRNHCMV